MSSILNIGQSALAAAQAGLNTTGHNIANASTPGYTRQSVVQSAALSQKIGQGYMGGGTNITGVTRAYDDLLTRQVRSSQSLQSASGAYLSNLKSIDTLMGDGKTGLSSSISDFYGSVQALTTDPLGGASRQAVLSKAQSLVSQFKGMDSQLSAARDSVTAEVVTSVRGINTAAEQISALNDTISRAVNSGQSPNDLMDQRDQLVLDLSKKIQVSVVDDGKAGFNIFIGNGQPLVVGAKTYQLVAQNSDLDPGRIEVAYQGDGKTFALPESSLTGGSLGGLLEFRSKILDPVQRSLGRAAIVMADTFNKQNSLGIDQDGKQGGNIFNVATPAVSPNPANSSKAVATAAIVDSSVMTTSDYKFSFDGTQYSVTRLSDGQSTSSNTVPAVMDGVSFGMSGPAPTAGDSFLVQPTINGAQTTSVAATSVRALATAAPVVTSATVSNAGSGAIADIKVDKSYFASPLSGPVALTVAAGASPGTQILSGFPDGSTRTISAGTDITYNGMTFQVTGSPANGDTFRLAPVGAEANDARNGLLLANLQAAKVVGGKQSIAGAYSELVSLVGNKTQELQSVDSANTKILTQAVASQQEVSGVSLDEEAANLMKYQQAYQAAAKVMQTASAMFDTLLSIGR